MNRNMMIDDNNDNDNVSTTFSFMNNSSCYLNLSNLLKQYHATSTLYRYIIEGTDITFQEYLYELILSSDDDIDNIDDRIDFITSLLLGRMNSTEGEEEEEINENEIRDSIQNIVLAINASHRHRDDMIRDDDDILKSKHSSIVTTPTKMTPSRTATDSTKTETSSLASTMFIQSSADDVVILPEDVKQDVFYEHKQPKTRIKDNKNIKKLKKKQQTKEQQTKEQNTIDKMTNDDDNDDSEYIGTGPRGSHFNSNSIHSNIHLTKVSLLMDNGNELLQDTTMDIQRGHRYGLVGRNVSSV